MGSGVYSAAKAGKAPKIRDPATVTAELATRRKKQEDEAAGLEPITGGWGDPETVKRLQEQSDTAQQVKGLLKEQEDIRAAQEQALIDSGESAPTYDLSPWDTPLDTPWVSNTMEGAAKTYGGSLLNLAGTVAQTMGELTPDDPGGYGIAEKMDREPFYNAARALKGKGRELTVSGSEAVERAKEGKGALGRLGTDVAVAGAQMLADQAANLLVPGSGMALMAARSAGSGMMEAEDAGADTATQLTAGAASGAISWLTENLSNIGPLKDIYGEGLLQKLAPRLAQRLTSSPMGTVALGFLGEAGEEVLEDVLDTAAEKLIYDPNAKVDPEEALYDGLVGGIIGAIGGGVEAVSPKAPRQGHPYASADPLSWDVTASIQPEVFALRGVKKSGVADGVVMDKKTTPKMGAASLEPYSQHEAQNFLTGAKNKVLGFGSDILEFAKRAILTKGGNERLYCGKLPQETADLIFESTGRDLSEFNFVISSDGVWHAYDHHWNDTEKTKGAQVSLRAEDMTLLPEVIAHPDKVTESPRKDGHGRVALTFEKQMGDTIVTITGISAGRKVLDFDSMRIMKEKSPAEGHADAAIDPSLTSKPISGQTSPSNIILPQDVDGVKAQDLQQPEGYSGLWTAPSAIGLPFNGPLQGTSPIYSGPIAPWPELSGIPEAAMDPLMRAALEMAESGAFENDPVISTEAAPVQPRDTAHSGTAPTELSAQETPRSAVPEGEPIGLTVRQRLTLDEVRYAGHSIEQVGMALKRMGPEAIRGVINQGLCSAPDMGSSTRARVLRRKLDAGQDIIPSELGHLYDALCREPTQWGSASGQAGDFKKGQTEGESPEIEAAPSGPVTPGSMPFDPKPMLESAQKRLESSPGLKDNKTMLSYYMGTADVVMRDDIPAPIAYNPTLDVIGYNPKLKLPEGVDRDGIIFHEFGHRAANLAFDRLRTPVWQKAIRAVEAEMAGRMEEIQSWFDKGGKYRKDAFLSDIISALSRGKIQTLFSHEQEKWKSADTRANEIFANMIAIDALYGKTDELLDKLYEAFRIIIEGGI